MNVYILGIDGYIGWALYKHLSAKGHHVRGCDTYFRRHEIESIVPLERDSNVIDQFAVSNLDKMGRVLDRFQPDAIVHLAEIPSAPFSMKSSEATLFTQHNNVLGSLAVLMAMKEICPEAHLVKLGSMGEYIPSSWYHMSKVLDSKNCEYACKAHGLAITDVMQGPVYGVGGRFDCDEIWGTVINRWIAAATINVPILIYGDGQQVRGFLPIQDSIQCLEIILEHPPAYGQYRVVNQYAVKHDLNELAEIVAGISGADIRHVRNPRQEARFYEGGGDNNWLRSHGYKPSIYTEHIIDALLEEVAPFADRIPADSLVAPRISWNPGP